MTWRTATCLVAALCAAPVRGFDGAEWSLPTEASWGTPASDLSTLLGTLQLDPRVELAFSDGLSLVASARAWLDTEDRLEPGETPRDAYAPGSRPLALGDTGSLALRDLYLEWRGERGLVRLGKQQVVWGRLDGIKVLDLVNPQDFREFILDDFDRSRIGTWSVYADWSFGPWRTELLAAPDGTAHAVPEPHAWFELTAPRFRFGAAPGADAPPTRTVRPGHGLDETGVGLRLSRSLGAVQWNAVAWSGMDPEPLGRIVNGAEGILVERYYERREALGFSAETSRGPVALRLEYAFQPERRFNTRDETGLGAIDLDQHRAAVALDWSAPWDLFVNVQFVLDRVSGTPPGLVRPREDRVATLFLRRGFSYDTVLAELRWYREFGRDDDLALLRLDYALTGDTRLRLSAEWFSGPSDGLFGQFRDRDRVVLSVEHTF